MKNKKNSLVNVDFMHSAIDEFAAELKLYRETRNKPKNNLYYICKMSEESGEVAEAALAFEGSKRKVKKIKNAGLSPKQALEEELADVMNTVFLSAEQFGIAPDTVILLAAKKLMEKRLRHV